MSDQQTTEKLLDKLAKSYLEKTGRELEAPYEYPAGKPENGREAFIMSVVAKLRLLTRGRMVVMQYCVLPNAMSLWDLFPSSNAGITPHQQWLLKMLKFNLFQNKFFFSF